MRLSEKEQENRVSLNADVMLRRALDLRDNNKLIAEFMGFTSEKNIGWYDNNMVMPQIVYVTNGGNCFDELFFDLSWDWLMPVIEKIATHTLSSTIEMLAEYYYKDGDNQDGLEGIEEFYKAVVFWIKSNQYLKTSEEMDLLDPVEDVSIFDVFMHINNENQKNKL